MTATQLTLPVRIADHAELASFYSKGNEQALAAIADIAAGIGEQSLYLVGAQGTGKTHLLLAAAQLANQRQRTAWYLDLAEAVEMGPDVLEGLEHQQLLCLDNVSAISADIEWERALFTLYNQVQDNNGFWLAADRRAPAQLPMKLPDLRTRLGWGLTLLLQPLDDQGQQKALMLRAKRRGLRLTAEAADYMLRHWPRGLVNQIQLLDKLDDASLADSRRLSVAMIKDTLGAPDQCE